MPVFLAEALLHNCRLAQECGFIHSLHTSSGRIELLFTFALEIGENVRS